MHNDIAQNTPFPLRGFIPFRETPISRISIVFLSNDIQKAIAKYQMPAGYTVETGGEQEEMIESFIQLALALLLSLLLIYMILASQFESLLQPFIEAGRALAAQGVLKRISGLLFGRPGGEVGAEHFGEYDQAILEICVGEEGLNDLPIVTNMDFGHTDPMLVLPMGAQVQIDCARRELAILESAVVE
mgnify:CR=1 FL=1